MRTAVLSLMLMCGGQPAFSQMQGIGDSTPQVSLFQSIEKIKVFLKKKAKQDYSDKYLSGVRLHYFKSHPKKGLAWVYSYSFKKPRLGGDISIHHYMDGEIIEFHHGP